MGKVANDLRPPDADLPAGHERVPTGHDRTSGADDTLPGTHETQPMSVARMLTLEAFTGAQVLAGARGLDRTVRSANVMEVPDILPWVRREGLLLTTGYPLRATVDTLPKLVADLDDRGVSAVAVKLHRYLDALPRGVLAEADRRGLPVILLPDGTGFDDVLTQVFTDVVSRRASLLERGEDVHRQLVDVVLAGGGVSEVTAALSRLVAAVAVVTAPDGRVLSEEGEPGQLAALRASSVCHPAGRFRAEAFQPGVHVVDDLPGSLAVVPVSGGRIDHGRLVVFDPGRVLTAPDTAVLARAATVAAISLTKEMAIHAVESKYRGDFLRDVLAGRAGTAEEVANHARSLGWDIARPVVVLVAAPEAEGPLPQRPGLERPLEVDRFAAAWCRAVARQDAGVPVVGFAAEVVALLPAPPGGAPRERVESAVRAVAAEVGGRLPFATGVSRVVCSADALPAAYEQARKALHVGRQLHGPRALVHFDDLGVFRLLSLIEDRGELEAFAAETLAGLCAPGSPEAADLRETLRVLLDANLNVAEAARRLHFHYNTLRYRIAKLEGLVGPFTRDPQLRLDLALALRIVALRGS